MRRTVATVILLVFSLVAVVSGTILRGRADVRTPAPVAPVTHILGEGLPIPTTGMVDGAVLTATGPYTNPGWQMPVAPNGLPVYTEAGQVLTLVAPDAAAWEVPAPPIRLVPPDSNTVIWWTLDSNADGGNWYNSGTAGADGLLSANSSPTCPLTTGLFNGAAVCVTNYATGANAPEWIATGQPVGPNARFIGTATDGGTSTLSVSAWVWPRSYARGSECFLGKQYSANGTWFSTAPSCPSGCYMSWGLCEGSNSTPGGTWSVLVTPFGGGVQTSIGLDQRVNADGGYQGILQLHQWQLVSFTYESAGGSVNQYWDGQMVSSLGGIGQGQTGANAGIDYHDAGGRFFIGGAPDGPPQGDMYYDDIRIESVNRCPSAIGSGPYVCPFYQNMTQLGLYGSVQ